MQYKKEWLILAEWDSGDHWFRAFYIIQKVKIDNVSFKFTGQIIAVCKIYKYDDTVSAISNNTQSVLVSVIHQAASDLGSSFKLLPPGAKPGNWTDAITLSKRPPC